jgi:putative transcriptional regulator
MRKRYLSRARAAIHETVEGLHRAGLMDGPTMRTFDARCLTPDTLLSAGESREGRRKEGASRPVFAHRRP